MNNDATTASGKAQELKAGCDILRRIEGSSKGRTFEQSVKFYLYGDRKVTDEAQCKGQ